MVYSVVAYSQNKVIGKDNTLPWAGDMPADMKHFRELTTGNTVVMGRKTYESIGRPLPNRQNIILTRDVSFLAPGCEVVHTIEQALQLAQYDVYIIGGASVYALAEPRVDVLCATEIMANFEGDTFFELTSPEDWTEISRQSYLADNDNKYPYDFVEYRREAS